MKSKKRHQTSSDESEESDASAKSSSTSGSESDDSSISEHRHKKRRKHADSSESESESDDQKRSKKRKHKKKKKKHGKKKRRSGSVEPSISAEELSSASEGEISSKKKRKHKHKHSKRARSASASDAGNNVEHRLHSVVKERRASSEEGSQPSRTYYQREYRNSGSGDDYERVREVQRFYRGSSKERRLQYQEQLRYEREGNDKYTSYQGKNERHKYNQGSQFNNTNEEYGRRPRDYDEYKRHPHYVEHRPVEEYHRRPREETYHSREDPRGYHHNNRYNQYEDRGPKRREYDDGRDYRERRGPPPEAERYRDREYQEKKERYQEGYPSERPREVRRERPTRPERTERPERPERPERTEKPVSQPREHSKSASPVDRYRDRSRRPDVREEREERHRDGRGDERQERPARSADRKEEVRPPAKSDSRPRERRSRFDPDENKEFSWGKTEVKKEEDAGSGDKEKPNFGLSGKLTAEANTVNGVVIKYTEPEDAKQPKRRWRFYPFKGDKALPILYIHRQSAFLIGRDKKVCDITLDHPSISKQHSALQYRATPFDRPDGSQGRRVRPYIIDLESANGTFVNNKKVEPRRYVELLERDVVKFGFSQREYVLLHENSKDDAQDDDNQETDALGAAVTTTDQIKHEKRIKQELVEDGE